MKSISYHSLTRWGLTALVLLGWATLSAATTNEAVIRKNLAQRLPSFPSIQEVRATPMPGLFEVRVQPTEIYYTDAQGNFLIQGQLVDTRTRVDLTEQRLEALTRLVWSDLPLKDALVTVRGAGKQKIAVFSDPNCGFCKRLERDLVQIDNVTVYTFLIPILGPDSQLKARNMWCAKDPAAAYNDWMLRGVNPATATCDTAGLERNLALAQRYRITGTPLTVLADGTRVSGADFKRIQQSLAAQPK